MPLPLLVVTCKEYICSNNLRCSLQSPLLNVGQAACYFTELLCQFGNWAEPLSVTEETEQSLCLAFLFDKWNKRFADWVIEEEQFFLRTTKRKRWTAYPRLRFPPLLWGSLRLSLAAGVDYPWEESPFVGISLDVGIPLHPQGHIPRRGNYPAAVWKLNALFICICFIFAGALQ